MPTIDELIENDDLGILRIPLATTIPAEALIGILSAVNDLYFGNLWLSLAEKNPPGQVFPDVYELTDEQTLYIHRLEIGTPNFLDLIGQIEYLLPALGVIGTTLGTATAAITIIKDITELSGKKLDNQIKKEELLNKQLDNRLKKLEIEQKERELHEKQHKIHNLVDEANKKSNNKEYYRVPIYNISISLVEKASKLAKDGKVSKKAYEHKMYMQQSIEFHTKYFLPKYAGKPSLTIVRKKKDTSKKK